MNEDGSLSHVHSKPSTATGNAFRKKVVIEARQFNPNIDFGEARKVLEWCGGRYAPGGSVIIPTLEDGPNAQVAHYVTPGDWIIKGAQGEFYACKADIFEATYESIAPQPPLPAKADSPSGPTDNDSKEEEKWGVGEHGALVIPGHPDEYPGRAMAEVISSHHNAALSALRARLQKQEERHDKIRFALSLAANMSTSQGCPDENHAVVVAAMDGLEALSDLSQTPALVHNQQISPTNPKHNK